MTFVCTRCGARQPPSPRCTACGDDNLLDLAKEDTRELLHEMNQRRRDRREVQIRMLAVVIGIAVVALLWTVPGYWSARGHYYPGLPFLADQWAFMILVALGAMMLLSRVFAARPLFPFVDRSGSFRE